MPRRNYRQPGSLPASAVPEVAGTGAVVGRRVIMEEAGADKPSGRSRGRGRGKPRAAREETAEPVERAETTDEEVTVVEPEELDKEDEPERLSDWNVPSWTDLIESLYRPDR